MVTVTSLIARTIGVIDTLTLSATNERISQVSGAAETNWSVVTLTIGARFTISIGAARIRVAKIALVEGSATIEWMSSVSLGARANGLVALDTALGANAASACARVDTLEIEASLGGAALLVLRALGVASGERIAQEVGRARANCAMVPDVTIGISSAGATRILTTEVHTSSAGVTFEIGFAFTTTSLDRIAHESFLTGADSPAVLDTTFGVGSARRWGTIIAALSAEDTGAG